MIRVRAVPGFAAPLAVGAALALGLALTPVLGRGAGIGPLGGAGVVAVAAYVAAVALPWPGVLPWALGLLAVEYLVSLELRSAPLDASAPIRAAAWFLCAEAGWLGLEARRGGRLWPDRALGVAVLAGGGVGLGAALLLASRLPLPGGAPLTALGVAAAISAGTCLAWLGRR